MACGEQSPKISFTLNDTNVPEVIRGMCQRRNGHPVRIGLGNSSETNDHMHKTIIETGAGLVRIHWTEKDEQGYCDMRVHSWQPGHVEILRAHKDPGST